MSAAELGFLRSGRLLGRLATSDVHGQPHVVPVGWRYDERLGTFEISGRDFAATRKYRNVVANPRAALVIDDVLPPWRPRCVHVQGPAQAVPADLATGAEALIRLTPAKVTSWGLDEEGA
ncbi:PPOX class F420-dependent oxidoreductase [Blastococcus xanthinilyticus]|uniref:Pyridoxamine 5'-phosphate oxidase family protein n=1 Tax=Blastococcus xanthinilyticus TaxID=1564164 RepID=A0A5S5CQ63_9ACTN|nr:PPOX class F420-dependent oxidoreductase [Blastococcus xanthinilyticus]TYP84906.1 pyridoxamine 5'-phosphate oxidase family protein [Blastococcus xanthinilyticus]